MRIEQAPANVAAAAAALGCVYNGSQAAIVRAGVVRFPALAYFTIERPGTPEHGATFTLPAAELDTQTLTFKHDDTCRRFAE